MILEFVGIKILNILEGVFLIMTRAQNGNNFGI